jgi:DNA-binding beta-propeller fold protein YncE
MKGGVFVGPLPKGSKTSSKPSDLEAKALEDHKDPDDGKVYDDLLTEVNIANPKSFATFARGKAIALFTKENLEKLMNTSTTYNRPLQDPITRQPFTPEVLAWINNIDEEGPFSLTMILPTEHTISHLSANETFLTLTDRQGTFTIYNTQMEEVTTLEEPNHNRIYVSPDGTHAVTYNYLNTILTQQEAVAKLWTITPETIKAKDLKAPLQVSVKGAFTTPDKKLYLYYSGNGFLQWDFSKTRLAKGKILKQEELYRPNNTYQMDIHYTNNKLVYYNNINNFMSYVQRNDDGTFTTLCENTPFISSRYETYSVSPVAFSLDGSKMATYNRAMAKLIVFDITQSKPTLLHEISYRVLEYTHFDLAFSSKYVFMGYSNKVVVIDLDRNKLVQTIKIGEEQRRTMYSDVPKIKVAYFSGYLVVAIGKLVHLFKE